MVWPGLPHISTLHGPDERGPCRRGVEQQEQCTATWLPQAACKSWVCTSPGSGTLQLNGSKSLMRQILKLSQKLNQSRGTEVTAPKAQKLKPSWQSHLPLPLSLVSNCQRQVVAHHMQGCP